MVTVSRALYLDCGNSRIKYSLGDDLGVFSSLLALEAFLASGNVSLVVIASVSAQTTAIVQLAQSLAIATVVAQVSDGFADFSLAYPDAALLGVDRWLAMLAALDLFPDQDVWVVDIGTALKLDYVSKDRRHQGGSISVGLQLAARTLSSNTARLPEADLVFSHRLGQNTTACLNFGIIYGAIALIEQSVQKFGADGSRVVLTGGDAGLVAPHLSISHTLEPDLVLRGLKYYWHHMDGPTGDIR
jgi:type III pantothenate kinase